MFFDLSGFFFCVYWRFRLYLEIGRFFYLFRVSSFFSIVRFFDSYGRAFVVSSSLRERLGVYLLFVFFGDVVERRV